MPPPPNLILENTTGHVLRAAADRILSEHTAPFSGLASAGPGTRPSNGRPYRVRRDTFDSAGSRDPRSETPPGVKPAFYFCTPASSFVTPIVYIRKISTATTHPVWDLKHLQNHRNASEFLSSTQNKPPPPGQTAYGLPTL